MPDLQNAITCAKDILDNASFMLQTALLVLWLLSKIVEQNKYI